MSCATRESDPPESSFTTSTQWPQHLQCGCPEPRARIVARASIRIQEENSSTSVPPASKRHQVAMIRLRWQVISVGDFRKYSGSGSAPQPSRACSFCFTGVRGCCTTQVSRHPELACPDLSVVSGSQMLKRVQHDGSTKTDSLRWELCNGNGRLELFMP